MSRGEIDGDVRLHVVLDSAGGVAFFGQRQGDWLVEHQVVAPPVDGLIHDARAFVYYALAVDDVEAINQLVLSVPELRECDFCRSVPTGWQVNVAPFDTKLGPIRQRFTRPLFACDVCVGYIERNEKDRLVEYAIATAVEQVRVLPGAAAAAASALPWAFVKEALTPQVREVVYGMFANRRGQPERVIDLPVLPGRRGS